MKNKVFVASDSFDIEDEINNGVFKDIEFEVYTFVPPVGGDWSQPLANILNNEIVVGFASTIAIDTAVYVLKYIYSKFKDKKSPRTDELRKYKKVIITEGNLVIKVSIDGQYIGAVGEENIDQLDYDFMKKIMDDHGKNEKGHLN